MSGKDFDNRIRKKPDSLQADYTPEAWESFRKLLPVPWYVTFFKTYGGWIFGGISSLILLFNFLSDSKPEPAEKAIPSVPNRKRGILPGRPATLQTPYTAPIRFINSFTETATRQCWCLLKTTGTKIREGAG